MRLILFESLKFGGILTNAGSTYYKHVPYRICISSLP